MCCTTIAVFSQPDEFGFRVTGGKVRGVLEGEPLTANCFSICFKVRILLQDQDAIAYILKILNLLWIQVGACWIQRHRCKGDVDSVFV